LTTDAAAQHRFEQQVNDCRRLLATVANQDAATRLKVFQSCAHGLAQGFIPRGIEKATVADALYNFTSAHLADVPVDDIQLIITDEIAEAEQIERVPDDVADFEQRVETPAEERKKTNGPERVYSKIRPIKIASAEDLQMMTFNPIKYVVPGIFVEGLTLLAGKPKVGKSWLLLHAALAVARGGFTLGEIHCIEGDVLYCALEDNERRLQSRITKLLNSSQGWPKGFFYCCELPRLGGGGAEHIRNWIMSVRQPRLVVIDTLAMVRALKKIDESNYQSDYLALLELRELASEFGIAIPVSHHLRKQEADDPFDTISGTLGLTGAVDSMLVLKRDSYGGYVLHGKGRDLIEVEKALTFDRDACLWRVEGDAAPIRRSSERTAILNAIAETSEPLTPTDIAAATCMPVQNVKFLLRKLLDEGAIEKAGYGKYKPKVLAV
jgi:AAA domain